MPKQTCNIFIQAVQEPDLKVECVVDPSVNAPVHVRTTEDPSDKAQLSGAELLARELGAKVIKTISGE